MGKRKRSTSLDRRADSQVSTADDQDSESSSHRKEVKRMKKEISEDNHFLMPSTVFLSSKSRESKSVNGALRLNEVSQTLPNAQQMGEYQDDDYDVWLVRKPVEVSLVDLEYLKFPKKAKSTSKLIEISNYQRGILGFADQLECRFERPHSQMLHIHTRSANSAKLLRNLKPCSKVKGVVWIGQVQKLIDEFPMLPDEDFLSAEQQTGQQNGDESTILSPPFMPFAIDHIRRKPELDLGELKERLQVFGGNYPSKGNNSRNNLRK